MNESLVLLYTHLFLIVVIVVKNRIHHDPPNDSESRWKGDHEEDTQTHIQIHKLSDTTLPTNYPQTKKPWPKSTMTTSSATCQYYLFLVTVAIFFDRRRMTVLRTSYRSHNKIVEGAT